MSSTDRKGVDDLYALTAPSHCTFTTRSENVGVEQLIAITF